MVREQVVGRMYNISPRERERYFLRTLLLNRAGAICFTDMRSYEGDQFPTFRETSCAMGLLSNDQAINDAFSSNFDALTEVFSVILAFCEPANPHNIWKETKTKLLADSRRRNATLCHEVPDFGNDEFAEVHLLNEIQMYLHQISPFLDLETVGLPKLPPNFSPIAERTGTEFQKPYLE